MKRVYSADILNLLPFIYSKSSKKCDISIDGDLFCSFKFDDIEFVFDKNRIPVRFHDESHYNIDMFNDGDILIENVHNIWGINDNFDILNKKLQKVIELCKHGINVLILDIVGDNHSVDDTNLSINQFINLFKTIPNLYFLTAREFFGDYQDKIKTKLSYLNLSHYYFYLSDSFFAFPYPDYSHITYNPSYDFISYLGLRSDIIDSKAHRFDIISKINFNNKTLFTPKTFLENTTKNLVLQLNRQNQGQYNWFNSIESRHAKIKLVFESFDPSPHRNSNVYCLTEKTFKCFIDVQPYFLIIHPSQKLRLRELGFKFPDPDDTESQIEYITNICRGDIDDWVTTHQSIFIHNNKLFKKYLYEDGSPHNKFLENIK